MNIISTSFVQQKRAKIKFKIPPLSLCSYCESDLADTWDHIIPHSMGGSDCRENLTPSCRRCNSLASNLVFRNFIEKKAYIKCRKVLSKKHLIKLAPRIKQVEFKIIHGIGSLADIILNKRMDFIVEIEKKSPRLAAPIGVWLDATPENALLLALGRATVNRKSVAGSHLRHL